jgi:predicted MPP superfamily phosphohydrolase
MKFLLSMLCLGLFVYISLVEPTNLQVEHVTMSHPYVSEQITLIHISDIQSKNVGHYAQSVFEALKDISADLILHTGDLVQPFYYSGYDVLRYEPELHKLAQLFRQLHPQYGIYNVIGDTELPEKIPVFDELSGVTTLQDEHVIILTPKGDLNILGLTLEHSRQQGERNMINEWIEQGEHRQVRIIMGHTPDYIQMVLDTEVNLCLAGHTHGGQIQIPVIGPLLASSSIPKS